MNKAALANDTAFEVVRTVCLQQGLPETALTRNTLQELSEDDGEDLAEYYEPESRFLVTFMDGRPSVVAMSLSPKRYELSIPAKVVVIAIGDEEAGRKKRIALIDAIAAAFDADPYLGGVATWCEMADDPDQDDDEDIGSEARAEIIMFQIDVADALTPRG